MTMNARDFAERALVGSLLRTPAAVEKLGWLQDDDFHSPMLTTLYGTVQRMVAETRAAGQDVAAAVTPITVFERVQRDEPRAVQDGPAGINAPTLHTLMQTAPVNADPVAYGVMVLESSIRRQVAETGYRVGQHIQQAGDLAAVLESVERALQQVAHAQARWDASRLGSGIASTRLDGAPDQISDLVNRAGRDLSLLIEPKPSAEQVADAEHDVINAVLANATVLNDLGDRLRPEDFHDRSAGNTYRAAVELHSRNAHVDPVTVSWELQRTSAQHGAGLAPDQLNMLQQQTATSVNYTAEIVMRGALARLTEQAAVTVRNAAQHPGLQPVDVLATTRMAYEAVRETASRMGAAARLASIASPVPIARALDGATGDRDTELESVTAHPGRRLDHAPER